MTPEKAARYLLEQIQEGCTCFQDGGKRGHGWRTCPVHSGTRRIAPEGAEMPKLTPSERATFFKIVNTDLTAINKAVAKQLRSIWDEFRDEIIREKGHDKLTKRKEELQAQIEELKQRIQEIENKLQSERLTVQQIVELGGEPDRYGYHRGANFYGIPVENQLDYEVVQRIKENIDVNAPAKFLHDLGRSVIREIAMAGTFEDAHKVYEKFYAMDFRKYGVDIPPRLTEIRKQSPLLQAPEPAKQIEDKRKVS